MYHQFGAILVFIFVCLAFVFGSLFVGSLVRQRGTTGQKTEIYECGEPTVGSSWIRYNSRFYNIALVYLLFDIEVVVLVPIALVFREKVAAGIGSAALLIVLLFVAFLIVGLAYEWFYGNLDWIRAGRDFEAENNNKSEGAIG